MLPRQRLVESQESCAALHNPADIARAELNDLSGDEAGITLLDSEHLETVSDARPDDRAQCRIHPRRVSPTGQCCHPSTHMQEETNTRLG